MICRLTLMEEAQLEAVNEVFWILLTDRSISCSYYFAPSPIEAILVTNIPGWTDKYVLLYCNFAVHYCLASR